MQLVLLSPELEMNPPPHTLEPEGGPFLENLPDPHHPGRQSDQNVEVAGEAVLQRSEPEELLHQRVGIGAALAVDGQLQAAQVGLVAHVGNFPHASALDQLDDLVNDRLDGGGRRNLGDLNAVGVLVIAVAAAHPDRSASRFIDLAQLNRVIKDLSPDRKIRSLEGRFHRVGGVADQRGRRLADLGQIKRTNRAGHADGDADVRVNEDGREGNRQKGRLLHPAVIAVRHIDGVAVKVGKKLLADRGQLDLCVTGGGEGHIPGVCLAEVSLGINIGMQQRLVALSHAHHRLIDRLIAVGMQLHHLSDRVGRLDPSPGQQTHLIHGKENLAVGGLKAVDLGNGAGNNDAHRIGHVVADQRFGDRLGLHDARVLNRGVPDGGPLLLLFLFFRHESGPPSYARSSSSR